MNYPRKIQFRKGHQTEYRYDAGGMKRQVVHKTMKTELTQPLSLGTYDYTVSPLLINTLTTDYCGNIIYEDGELKMIRTAEGYVKKSGTTFKHYAYIKDYLGNNRVVMDGSYAVQESNYYPGGLVHHANLYSDGHSKWLQPYMFGDKELDEMHGLNLYDFEARQYDGIAGGFTTMDPLAEKYYSISSYAYCANNPVRFIDPDGRVIRDEKGRIVTQDMGQTVMLNHKDAPGKEFEANVFRIFTNEGNPITVYQSVDKDRRMDTNCHGTTFADGQFWLNPKDLETLIQDDLVSISGTDVEKGDIAIFSDSQIKSAHSETVVSNQDGNMIVNGLDGLERKASNKDINTLTDKGYTIDGFYRKKEDKTMTKSEIKELKEEHKSK